MRRGGWGRQTFPPKTDHGGSADHSERRPTRLEPLKPGSYIFNIGLIERKKTVCVANEIYGKVESARASSSWPLVPI